MLTHVLSWLPVRVLAVALLRKTGAVEVHWNLKGQGCIPVGSPLGCDEPVFLQMTDEEERLTAAYPSP